MHPQNHIFFPSKYFFNALKQKHADKAGKKQTHMGCSPIFPIDFDYIFKILFCQKKNKAGRPRLKDLQRLSF